MMQNNKRNRSLGRTVWCVILAMIMTLLTGCGSQFGDPNRVIPLTPVAFGGQDTMKDEPVEIIFVSPQGEPEGIGIQTLRATNDYVHPIGRTVMLNDVRWCGHSGSGVSFVFVGTQCRVHLCSDGSTGTAAPRIGIWVDGEMTQDILLEEDMTVLVVDNAEDAMTDVRIIKLSECAESVCGIESFEINGMMLPVTPRERRIEFIGDSITCGYGVDGVLGETFRTQTEDCTKAFACQTAQLLNAEYSLVSFSGFGIVSGYTLSGEKLPDKTLPQYYDKLGFSYGAGFAGSVAPDHLSWDFRDFVPDTVVINLGTNDMSYCGTDAERTEEFVTGYCQFLSTVRHYNPDAYIVCTLGMMGTGLCESMERAVKLYSEQSGDANITTFCFEEQNQEADGIGIDWHPSRQTQWKAAQALADFLMEHYGE